GIGAAIAKNLLSHGARVTILGRSVPAATANELLRGNEDRLHRANADVTDRAAVKKAFDSARSKFGAIEILVNCAGQASSAPILKTDAELWRRMMAINLDGTFHCIQEALPGMLSAGWGRIVNIASTAGLIGYPYVSAYCASKHAVVGLTRALALELAQKGITV